MKRVTKAWLSNENLNSKSSSTRIDLIEIEMKEDRNTDTGQISKGIESVFF